MSGSAGGCRALLMAVGSRDRGDDGVGARVLECLVGRLPGGVRVSDCTGDPLAWLAPPGECRILFAVDAAAPAGSVGRIHRLDLSTRDLPIPHRRDSTHGLGLSGAIALARKLAWLPPRVIVYAVEGACFEPGVALSGAVAAALDGVRRAAAGRDNLLDAIRPALAAEASLGEVCQALVDVFGRYRPLAPI